MASTNLGNAHLHTPLVRDGSSLYSLTFEEFQNVLGEPGANLGSMNMDELLKNIWTAEESQAMAAAMNSLEGSTGGLASQFSLQKQGSLCFPRTLSGKTVEEVWKNLQPQQGGTQAVGGGVGQRQITLGEVTLEDFLVRTGIVKETTPSNQAFISFGGNGGFSDRRNDGGNHRVENGNRPVGLIAPPQLMPPSANVLSGPSLMNRMQFDTPQSMNSSVQQGDWINNAYRKAATQQQQHGQQLLQRQVIAEATPAYGNTPNVSNGPLMETSPGRLSPVGGGLGGVLGKGGLGMNLGGGTCLNGISYGAGSPLSPALDESSPGTSNLPLCLRAQYRMNGQQQGRKRCADGPVEKVIERRQRRMIKNRESAARSRARKQAYTVELEAEVSQLKEENMELLRKQEEEAARRKKQILAVMPSLVAKARGNGCPLKRTYTGPW